MPERVFKTAWFSKAAKKANNSEEELCSAFHQVMQGQADNLGGGVFKKRIGDHLYRSLILAKGGQSWVYAYLFAKNNRANITSHELANFRSLARLYAVRTIEELDRAIQITELLEICL